MKDIIISDFDETITSKDTICILGELPYLLNPSFEPRWSYFEDAYMKNYHKFHNDPKSFGPKITAKRTLPLISNLEENITEANFKILFEAELRYQKNRRVLERSSTEEMEKYGLFKGIAHNDIRQYIDNNFQGESSLLRKGFKSFISSLVRYEFYIISINWSKEFIHSVTGIDLVDSAHIFCNQLISEGDIYTGQFSNEILTGSDKLIELEKLLKKHELDGTDNRFWYIGDSETDLLSIFHPKVSGVLLLDPASGEGKFMKLTTHVLKISSDELDNFIKDQEKDTVRCYEKENGNAVFIVKSWSAIQKLIDQRIGYS